MDALGETLADGLIDALALEDGLIDADGDTDAEAEALGETLADGDIDALGEPCMPYT